MEAELGSALFIRSKQGVYLTNYGKELFPYIKNVQNSEEYLQQAVAQIGGMEKGVVRIGTFNSACVEWMPSLLRGFEKDYPNIRIDIYQGSYDDVYQWLKDGIVDLGFLSSTSAGDLPCTPIYQDKIICVAPQGFKTENEGYITIEELKKQRFVTQREGCDADVKKVYPVIAGQVGIGCCKRTDGRMRPEKFYRRLVLSLPTVSNADGWKDDVFFAAQTKKLNKSEELKKLGIEFATILPYSPPKDQKNGKMEYRSEHYAQTAMSLERTYTYSQT